MWASFLRSQADALLACDFFETVSSDARIFVLAVIEHHSRRVCVLGATAHPTASWVTQATWNLVMDPCRRRAAFLIGDRDGSPPNCSTPSLVDARIKVVLGSAHDKPRAVQPSGQ
jgi:hypothetical protein